VTGRSLNASTKVGDVFDRAHTFAALARSPFSFRALAGPIFSCFSWKEQRAGKLTFPDRTILRLSSNRKRRVPFDDPLELPLIPSDSFELPPFPWDPSELSPFPFDGPVELPPFPFDDPWELSPFPLPFEPLEPPLEPFEPSFELLSSQEHSQEHSSSVPPETPFGPLDPPFNCRRLPFPLPPFPFPFEPLGPLLLLGESTVQHSHSHSQPSGEA
jgi:hypothetical protein